MSSVPKLFTAMIDDAAVFPPGNAAVPDAVSGHRTHRAAWYAALVGPLLVPASRVGEFQAAGAAGFPIGLIGDSGLPGLDAAIEALGPPRQVEMAVAKRGEDPVPGLRALLAWADGSPFHVYAEIPLTWGCLAALDLLAEHRSGMAKFRTGGLAAELFPTPQDLASVIVACAQRRLRFKLTAGLHHAVRHTDPRTGFTHHGYLNVLVATAAAHAGERPATVAELLTLTTPDPLTREIQGMLHSARPLWTGFGSCDIAEPLQDLVDLGLLSKESPR